MNKDSSSMQITLKSLLDNIPKDTEERVDRTRKRIHAIVRENMRSETGLLLNRQEFKKELNSRRKNIAVPIQLMPGFPASFEKVKFDEIDELVLLISPYRRKIEQAKNGLYDTKPLIEALLKNEHGKNLINGQVDAFKNATQLIETFLEIINKKDPVEQILSVDDDILGIYSYQVYKYNRAQLDLFYDDPCSGHIEIYWGLIGLVAGMLGTSVESLAAVVIIHEIAHAYTHLGADIDGVRWDSRWFAESEHFLIEGLAQYYTHYITERIDTQIPGTHEAYMELRERQPEAYKIHVNWVQEFQSEEIRHALIAIRRKRPAKLNQFIELMNDARSRLRGDKTRP